MYKKSQQSSENIFRGKKVILLLSFGFSSLTKILSLMSSPILLDVDEIIVKLLYEYVGSVE